MSQPLKVALVGFGAIGSGVCAILDADSRMAVNQIVVTDTARQGNPAAGKPRHFVEALDLRLRPDVLVECAGHAAIEQHVLPALQAGIPCMVVSVGALAETGMVERLEQAANAGQTAVQILSGAIGAIDALAAARIGGLDTVRYEGRKPPLAWQGTPAEFEFDLGAIQEPVCIFQGNAREAAQRFPKNANVAATVALAGLGLEGTQVALYADPTVSENHHCVTANGAFGSFTLTLRGKPLPANPKTSALTVYSVVRALNNRAHALAI